MRDKTRIFTLFLANILPTLTLSLAMHDDAVKQMFKMHHLVHVIFSLKAEPYSGNNAYNAASKIKAYSVLIGRLPLFVLKNITYKL